MRDFMCDDHNHSDSVTSLSVQIYTVPTIAYMLITNEDCLFVVTRTFYDECINRRNARECDEGACEVRGRAAWVLGLLGTRAYEGGIEGCHEFKGLGSHEKFLEVMIVLGFVRCS